MRAEDDLLPVPTSAAGKLQTQQRGCVTGQTGPGERFCLAGERESIALELAPLIYRLR
jgi:hypothetical protein